MDEKEHAEASKRGDLHQALSNLVKEHGIGEVAWMLDVIQNDIAEAEGWSAKMLEITDGDESSQCSLAEFLEANVEDLHVCIEAIKLQPGQSVTLGGGAAPEVTIRLIS